MQQPSEREYCVLAQRALAVASCAQILTEGGHQISSISITEKDAVILLGNSMKAKKLRGCACGATYRNGALYVVYQRDISGVLVKWLEPYFDAQHAAKKVH